jgi:hypothetical protein
MSYSYIQNVFPDYKTSKVYDDSLYTKINTSDTLPIKLDGYNEGYPNGEYKSIPIETIQSVKPIENFQNNLSYYNQPINNNSIPNYHNINLTNPLIENLTNTNNIPQQQHIELQHVLECDQCKKILMKQFNIENDKLKHEEIIELISYIIFGLFMLYLIDSLKK